MGWSGRLTNQHIRLFNLTIGQPTQLPEQSPQSPAHRVEAISSRCGAHTEAEEEGAAAQTRDVADAHVAGDAEAWAVPAQEVERPGPRPTEPPFPQ